jgi:hypothetical protein
MKKYLRFLLFLAYIPFCNVSADSFEKYYSPVSGYTTPTGKCAEVTFMTDDGFYHLYECKNNETKNKHYAFKRMTTSGSVEEIQLPWRKYGFNTLVFGYCETSEEPKSTVSAVLPDDGKEGFVSIKKVLIAWRVNQATKKMEQISHGKLTSCYGPGG